MDLNKGIKGIKELVSESFKTVCEKFGNSETAIDVTVDLHELKISVNFNIDRDRYGIDSYSSSIVDIYHDGTIKVLLGESLDGSDIAFELEKLLANRIDGINDINDFSTIGSANQLVGFGPIIKALEDGKRVRRHGWDKDKIFIFRQVPSEVPSKFVSKMTSLPNVVKDYFIGTFTDDEQMDSINYLHQIALVGLSNRIISWIPTVEDIMSEDWVILD